MPTTVPPYVLEAQFDKLRLQDKGTVDGNVTDDKNLPKSLNGASLHLPSAVILHTLETKTTILVTNPTMVTLYHHLPHQKMRLLEKF